MTKEDDNPQLDPCVASLLAVTLVSQVLDEASVIANAAKDAGQPWQYLTSLKKLRSSRYNEFYDDDPPFTIAKSNGDSQYYQLNDTIENLSNAVVTSTPQKDVHGIKSKNESNIVGQGDEQFELSNAELKRSTSMIINHMFDMSDVEYVNACDETNIIPTNSCQQNDLIIEAMTKIMDSCVSNALNIVFGQDGHGDDYRLLKSHYFDSSDHTEKSSYSFLSDYDENCKDVCSNINNEAVCEKTDIEELYEIESENKKINNEITFYENAYLTLNRDYEQYSEEDEPVLQDPKAIPLQEVELITANTSSEDKQPYQGKELVPTATSSAGSRKSTLVRRCRLQGARILSCLKGWWWRRKLPGRRKAPRTGSIRGACPLSPDARRRAASLLDHRILQTPSSSTSMVWKFNTINEALVQSSRWEEFGLKMSLNENDEF